MKSILTIALGSALLFASPVMAEPADVAAAVANPDRGEQDRALDESRQPARVLAFLGLERGDAVVDILSGGGYYAELMARAVGPEGYVLGQNPPPLIDRFNLGAVFEARDYGGRIANADQYNVPFGDFVLPPDSIDFAMFHLVFHDLYFIDEERGFPAFDRETMLARLYRGMKPGGIVGIVDHVGTNAEDPEAEVSANHRIAPEIVRAAMEHAGFVFEEESAMLANPDDDHTNSVFDPAIRGQTDRFVYRFRKPADAE